MKSITLTASKDDYISEFNPTQNFFGENDDALFVSQYKIPGDAFRTLLQFELKNPLLPSNAAIKRAYLLLSIYRNEIPSGVITGKIYRLLNSWDKHTVTWNNQPSCSVVPDQTFILPTQWTGLMIIDISTLTRSWIDGSIPNNGLVIIGDENNNRVVGFRNNRFSDVESRPKLVMDVGQ